MRAHDSYLTTLLKLSDAIFNIPVYQRNYDWETDDCKQLFTDIETITETGKDHFIGSIVYISIGTATEPYYNIIDGQQRITSVMLFLKALYDSTDDETFKKRVRHSFLINIGLDDKPKMKLKQIESDRSVYEKIVMQQSFDERSFTEDEKNTNVYKNYICFKKLVLDSYASLQDLYNAVFKLEIIDVCLTTEDPQEVFESMNSTGKSLTTTDLLRNYLLMDLTQQEQERLYKNYWKEIEANVGKNQMNTFMVQYLIMKRKSDSMALHKRSAKINKATLYDCYKLYFPKDKKRDGGTETLLKDMYHFSVLYSQIVYQGKLTTDLQKSFHEVIYDLNADSVAIFLMYLLDIQEEEGITDDDMLKAIQACTSYVFRVRVFKGSVSPQFFALVIQYYERSDKSSPFIDRVWDSLVQGSGSYRFPRDREFQDAFENKNMYLEFKPPMLRYMLYKYERSLSKEVVEPEDVTIEHIMPQETNKWQKHLAEIRDSEYRDLIHRIGNLTLTKMNGETSNAPFEEKKKIYKTSGYTITRELANCADWTSSEIKARSVTIAKAALMLWPLPERYNQDIENTWQTTMMKDETEELFNQFCSLVRNFDPSIYEDPKKMYINFMRDKKIVFSAVPYQDRLVITFNTTIDKLTPQDKLEDVSNKGHWGVGNCKMKIESEDDIWTALEYVQQIISDS